MTDTTSKKPRRVIVDVPSVNTHCHHYQGSQQCEEPDTRQRVVIALAELEAWAMSALERKTPPHLLGVDLENEEQPDRISNERRANYVTAIRLHMAIEQISSVTAIHLGVKHPKAEDLLRALKDWANRAYAAAEPTDPVRKF